MKRLVKLFSIAAIVTSLSGCFVLTPYGVIDISTEHVGIIPTIEGRNPQVLTSNGVVISQSQGQSIPYRQDQITCLYGPAIEIVDWESVAQIPDYVSITQAKAECERLRQAAEDNPGMVKIAPHQGDFIVNGG